MCVLNVYITTRYQKRALCPRDWMMVNCHVTVGESNPGPLQEQT